MTDWRDPDAKPSALGVVEQQDDAAVAWQEARRRVLVRTDLKCETCGVEHGKRVWKYLYSPGEWWPIVPGQRPHRQDLGVVDVIVIVIPVALPWSGEDDDLQALCMGCWFARDVAAVRQRWQNAKKLPEPQLSLQL